MGDRVFNNTLDHILEDKFGKYHDCMLKRDEYQATSLRTTNPAEECHVDYRDNRIYMIHWEDSQRHIPRLEAPFLMWNGWVGEAIEGGKLDNVGDNRIVGYSYCLFDTSQMVKLNRQKGHSPSVSPSYRSRNRDTLSFWFPPHPLAAFRRMPEDAPGLL
jgi:hypothetical protein